MRRMRFGIALLLVLPLTGCITLNERSIDHDFDGLRAAMVRSSTVSMLLVHGMGGYSVGDPQALIASIQSSLRLRPAGAPQAIPVPHDADPNAETLTRQDFTAPSGHALRIYKLDWEPLTENLKRQYLAYDDAPDVTRPRLRLHNDLKQSLMNENVPDVVLYVGTYQRVMQRAVRFALGRMQNDMGKGEDYEYFFVTFSLGSKIVFDVVDEMDAAPEGSGRDKIVDRTASFFMLANQLPLLGLGNVSPTTTRPAEGGAVPGYESMLRFVRRKHVRAASQPQAAVSTQPAGGGLSIVAVSDPNDLFSYTIPPYVKQQFPATFVNVQISVAKTGYWIPSEGYVANPMEAHTGYGHDQDVIKLIVEGGRATAPRR